MPGDSRPFAAFEPYVDTTRMLPALQERLGVGVNYTSCTIAHVQCRSYLHEDSWHKASLAVCYELDGGTRDGTTPNGGTRDGRGHKERLFARVHLAGRSAQAFDAIDPELRHAQGIAHWDELGMLVWRFPSDPALPQLGEATVPERVRRHLPADLLPSPMSGFDQQVMRYQPGKQCTSRFLVIDPDLDPDHRAAPAASWFGKTFGYGKGRIVHDRACRLGDLSTTHPELRVPRTMGHAEAIDTVWLEDVGGLDLAHVMAARRPRGQDMPGAPHDAALSLDTTPTRHATSILCEASMLDEASILHAVARGLTCVHRSGLQSRTTVHVEDLMAQARKKAAKLAVASPKYAADLSQIVELMEHLAAGLTPRKPSLTYGDFHLEQLRLDADGRIVFLDHDSFAMGDIERDLAEFIVDLRVRALDPDPTRPMTAHLIDAYQRASNGAVDPARLAWHLRHQTLDAAYHGYVRLAPTREAYLGTMLEALAQDAAVVAGCIC